MTTTSTDALEATKDEVFFQSIPAPTKLTKRSISAPCIKTFKKMPDRPTRMVDDVFDPIVTQSVDTIRNFVKPLVDNIEDKDYIEHEFMANVYSIIHIMETTNRSDPIYSMIVKTTFMQFKFLCRGIGFMQDNPSFLMLVKALFHRYIAVLGHTELIEIYNEIFTDNLYSKELASYVFVPTLPDEWKLEKIKEYQEYMQQVSIRKNAKKAAPKYEMGEIVGAKDKEGRWWMSKVLALFEVNAHIVYYVEFIGWGEKFNEFIADGFRIQKFNPKKHRYFRPAWAKKPLAVLNDAVEVDKLIEQDVIEQTQDLPDEYELQEIHKV